MKTYVYHGGHVKPVRDSAGHDVDATSGHRKHVWVGVTIVFVRSSGTIEC